jgi:hypothetical protein
MEDNIHHVLMLEEQLDDGVVRAVIVVHKLDGIDQRRQPMAQADKEAINGKGLIGVQILPVRRRPCPGVDMYPFEPREKNGRAVAGDHVTASQNAEVTDFIGV